MRRYFIILGLFILALFGCDRVRSGAEAQIVVSIEPLRWLVGSMVDSSVRVTVLVPPSTSPETYEPTVRQIEALSNAELYFSIGLLDFEQELAKRISTIAPATTYINLSSGIELRAGTCSHAEHEGHSHGIDPHIWLSPKLMRQMAVTVGENLAKRGLLDTMRYNSTLSTIDSVAARIGAIFAHKSSKRIFAIVHPSLSYFAADYHLSQLELEIDGKEPSAAQITSIVERMRESNITTILYSKGSSDAIARVVAKEIGATLSEYDPLAPNWDEELLRVSSSMQK